MSKKIEKRQYEAYPWGNELKKAYNSAANYEELMANLKRLHEKWTKKGKTKSSFVKLLAAARYQSKALGYAKERHAQKGFLERMAPERLEVLKRALHDGKSERELLAMFPEFNGSNETLWTMIRRMGGRRKFGYFRRGTKHTGRNKAIEVRVQQLVHEGILSEQGAAKAIYLKIKSEFLEQMEEVSFESFRKVLGGMIWSPLVIQHLKKAIRQRLDPESIYPALSHIPHRAFLTKWRELKGPKAKLESVEFVSGILRISKGLADMPGTPVVFQSGTFKNPVPMPWKKKGKALTMAYLNGVNLGIPYSPLFEENVIAQALNYYEVRGIDTVFMTNFLDIPAKKASGPMAVYRALFSGRTIDPNNLDPDYRQEAERILRKKPHDEMVFQTFAEMFVDSLQGLLKVFGPKERPRYSGPIQIIFGYRDEEYMVAAAYAEAHYFWQIKLDALEIQKKILVRQVAKGFGGEKDLRKVENLISRTKATNIDQEKLRTNFYKVQRFVTQSLEATIPNCKVIGMSSATMGMEDKKLDIVIPRHDRVSDELLADYCGSYGPKVLRGAMADAVVICHPFAINFRATLREADTHGKRKSVPIFVAPTLVDAKFIRENITRGTLRIVHKAARMSLNEQYQAGTLILRFANNTFQAEPVRAEALQHLDSRRTSRRTLSLPDYIWTAFMTDPHIGSASRAILAKNGKLYGMSEGTMEQMRYDGLFTTKHFPIHSFVMNDDGVQAHNFPTQQQPHPNRISFPEIQARMRDLKDPEEIKKLALRQFWLRGEAWTQDQVEQFMEIFINSNVDFFDAILRRFVHSGLVIRPLSEHTGEVADKRDVGAIMFGSGNHTAHSTDGEIVEGPLYATPLRYRLLSIPYWRDKEPMLKKLVRAPLYGNKFVAQGTIGLPGVYEYGLDHRDSPPGGTDWRDPLLKTIRNGLRRGNVSRIFDGLFTVKSYGDKHFWCAGETNLEFHQMAPPDTSTDVYAEGFGFPPNNTGVSFLGLPVEGPRSGPILARVLSYDVFKEYFENGRHFDWGSFLPNPV